MESLAANAESSFPVANPDVAGVASPARRLVEFRGAAMISGVVGWKKAQAKRSIAAAWADGASLPRFGALHGD